MFLKATKAKYKKIKNQLFPSMYQRMRLHYAENYNSKLIDDNLILYETRDGKSIVDSPYAIFLELAKDQKYSNYKHLWVFDKNIENIKQSIPEQFREKVIFVERGTIEYVDAMLSAKYLITNSTFESFFIKRENQVYINTWHGTPLKFMGFDLPGLVNHSQNVLRNFLMTDYIISPNKHTSDIFINSYKLNGIYPGKILEGGYPRIDLTLNSNKEAVKNRIQTLGKNNINELPILLFSPTWKGSVVNNAEDEVEQIIQETLTLVEKFSTKYNVLVKVHPFIYGKVKLDERISPFLVSDLMDANEVLSITDILITDYSSIFFDYLVTKKPIIFYSWDQDLYQQNRGMYLEAEDLPGPTAENIHELIDLIENVQSNAKLYIEKYKLLSEKMVSYDDGKVTKKYIDFIFDNKEQSNMTIRQVNSEKQKILIYPGGMKNNGITSSLLNLVNNIDYDKYDVTIITNSSRNQEINSNLRSVNSNARIMFRFGVNILTKKERKIDKIFMSSGVAVDERDNYPSEGYKREMNRLMSNLSFDVAIDFSGYSYFWGRHILASNAKKYVAFMHNDLMADSMREVNGKTPMKTDLHGLFSIYYQFDKLLSVSPMTRDVNLEKLSDFVSENQMSFVYNSININQILNSKESAAQINKNEIRTSKALKIVKESIETKFFKNTDAIKDGHYRTISLTKDENVVEHATFEFENNIYSKVSIEGVYIGWVSIDLFVPRQFEVIEMKKVYGYGTVSKAYHFPIWKNIRVNSEEDQIVAYARHFKLKYLEIIQSARTNKGLYYQVKYKDEVIGWMSSKPLMRIHKINRLSPLRVYFRNKMKKMDEINPVIHSYKVENKLELFAKLKSDRIISIWTEPSVVTESVELPISDEYLSTGFVIKQKIYFKEGNFCRLTLEDGSFVGYVEENMIDEISKDEYDILNFSKLDEEYGLSILPKMDLTLQKVPEFKTDYFNLVNMGRLSPEKNQKQLILAFKKFNKENSNSRLYILGKGPLQGELIAQIKELNLEGKVILLGHISNPFEFIKLNDYFVLPSFYEGQPMVLLESLTVGLKILASNIPANINVVGEDEKYGLLTEGTNVEDIYNGLNRAYNYKGQFSKFIYEEYNINAMKSFYKEIL